MTPEDFLRRVVDRGLVFLHILGGPQVTDEARRFLLCVAMQEGGADLEARYQGSPAEEPGPARGRWQCEQGGAVKGVLGHLSSAALATAVCKALVVVHEPAAVWRALEGNDLLAASFARLLLLTDPSPIPITEQPGWACYERLWRPGKPHPEVWPQNWKLASDTVAAHPWHPLA